MNLRRHLKSLKTAVGVEESPAQISKERSSPAKLLLLGYLSYVVAGWIVLSLPVSQAQPLGSLDTLFTAVSAVSTTGLTSIDTGASYTLIGQVAILLMFQLGGIGYMTVSSFAFLSVSDRLNQTQEKTARTAYSLPNWLSSKLFIRSVVLFTLGCEAAGALALFLLLRDAGDPTPIWSAIFHAVSAFCTAGFSLNAESFVPYADDVGINLVLSILSILGAMGFIVVADVMRRIGGNARHFGFTTKIIVRTTLLLLLVGTVLIFLAEPMLDTVAPADRLLLAFFQAMTASTTVGFNTIDISGIGNATAMVLMVLMLIGASPAGTGGGIKTTSFAAMLALAHSTLKGRDAVMFFGRQMLPAQVQAAATTFISYIGMLCVALFFLSLTEHGVRFEIVAFEAVSAIGTVGLSMGLTDELSVLGKLIIILLMFAGRLGILTFGLALTVPDDGEETKGDNELAL